MRTLVCEHGSLVFVWHPNDRITMYLNVPDARRRRTPKAPNKELTPAELKVVPHLVDGLSNKEIAAALSCSETTAHFHVGNICRKLDARNRLVAAVTLVRKGLA